MNDFASTGIAYVLTVAGLWMWSKKSKRRAIRYQWRRPLGVLIRTFALILVLHIIFVALGFQTAIGYIVILLVPVVVLLSDFTGIFGLLALGMGFLIREWIFWFPSRREFIARNPGPNLTGMDPAIIGLSGVALTDLKPTGIVSIDETKQPARAVFGIISKGDNVVVESVGAFEFRVRKL